MAPFAVSASRRLCDALPALRGKARAYLDRGVLVTAAALPGLDVFVRGIPRTEGSTKLRRGKITHDDPDLQHWRGNIYAALLPLWRKPDGSKLAPLDGPIRVDLTFFAHIPDRRRYWPVIDWLVRSLTSPTHWAATPGRMDVEKLARAVFDGVTSAGVWKDDGLVVELTARKYFAAPPDLPPGVRIRIEAIDARPPPLAT